MPRISIIAPVYGVEKYIEQFLDSIRNQTFEDFEAILVDDGSQDNCPQILDEFAKEDIRYHVIHQANGGVSVARNTGLEEAEGEYVYIVDSDDWMEPTALESFWEEVERNHPDVIYGDCIFEGGQGTTKYACFKGEFYTTDPDAIRAIQFAVDANVRITHYPCPNFNEIRSLGGAPWRYMIKTSVIKENDLQFDSYVRGLGDDILFALHLYEYVTSVSYITKVIYHYRRLDDTYSHGFKQNYLESIGRIFEKQEEFLNEFHKDGLAWQAYYIRVYLYLKQGMQRYFLNSFNPKSAKELFCEFKNLMKIEPYCSAFKNIPTKFIRSSKRMMLYVFLLRFGRYRTYWNVMRRNAVN